MPEIMTLKDVADYLRINERTVARLAQDAKIPGFKVASQWRFSKEAIDAWFTDNSRTSTAVAPPEVPQPRIAELLNSDSIILDLAASHKDGVLSEMVDLLVASGAVTSPSRLVDALREREKLCSTGVGRGIAFLHPRHVDPEITTRPAIAFARCARGIDFDAVDGEPVNLFFLDCATSERAHLAVLARLSRLLADESLVAALNDAETVQDVLGALSDAEARIVAA